MNPNTIYVNDVKLFVFIFFLVLQRVNYNYYIESL